MPYLKPEPLPANLQAEAVATIQALRRGFPRWARTCFHIRTKHGTIVPLRLNTVQRAIHRAEQEMLLAAGHVRLMILKARQGGVTTGQQAANVHQIWSEPHFDAMTMAHTGDDTNKIFGITNRAIEYFPPPFLPRLGARETREISFPGLDSNFWTGTAGASRTGRGLTLKRVHGSEVAFWPDLTGILGAIAPALVPERSVIVLETTADELDSPAHQFWQAAKREENGYRALFFPWWECDHENYRLPLLEADELGSLAEDETALVAKSRLDLEQLKWRRAKMRELGRRIFFTEYAEDEDSCWAALGELYYDDETLRILLARAPEPLASYETDMRRCPGLKIYGEPPKSGETVIIGGDTAEGSGGDRSSFEARALPSWRLLLAYQSNTVTPKQLAGLLADWGERLAVDGQWAYLVIEKNAHGITVLRELRDSFNYPIADIYHRMPLDLKDRKKKTEHIGWLTTGESKHLMVDAAGELFTASRDGYAGVPPATVIADALKVKRLAGGTVDLNGKDALVAAMLAWLGRSRPRRGRGLV